ncbi:hypothetical protein N9L18_00275 [Candidatus Pacebacteria bacterium]|nr:hypothetical protein [Candidatus Paceibacterota bacterium]
MTLKEATDSFPDVSGVVDTCLVDAITTLVRSFWICVKEEHGDSPEDDTILGEKSEKAAREYQEFLEEAAEQHSC